LSTEPYSATPIAFIVVAPIVTKVRRIFFKKRTREQDSHAWYIFPKWHPWIILSFQTEVFQDCATWLQYPTSLWLFFTFRNHFDDNHTYILLALWPGPNAQNYTSPRLWFNIIAGRSRSKLDVGCDRNVVIRGRCSRMTL
jgi:hypothetical protein